MGSGGTASIRSLPRVFIPGVPDPCIDYFELPKEEYDKFHKVLRLSAGNEIAVLPNDGRLVRCRLQGRGADPVETLRPDTESPVDLTLALALPKPEKLEESVRMATELGVRKFVVFPSDRTVVKWDADKTANKLARLERIAREAAEVSFRTKLPLFEKRSSLVDVLKEWPEAIVMSESETAPRSRLIGSSLVLVVGPEGGWSPKEVAAIGDRAISLGPRVFRVDTAVAAACSLALLAE